jgi:hypothetical protein
MPNSDLRERLLELLSEVSPGLTSQENSLQVMVKLLPQDGADGGGRAEIGTVLGAGGNRSLIESLSQMTRQLEHLKAANQSQSENLEANTQATLENSVALASGAGRSAAETVGKAAESFFGKGLILSPLVSGLIKLFGGQRSEPVPTLERYTAPPSIGLEAGLSEYPQPALQTIRYGQDGLPETIPAASASQLPPITVQVQAIDSRSFLDHSEAIARAVKDAILNSHSLNDVVTDL